MEDQFLFIFTFYCHDCFVTTVHGSYLPFLGEASEHLGESGFIVE